MPGVPGERTQNSAMGPSCTGQAPEGSSLLGGAPRTPRPLRLGSGGFGLTALPYRATLAVFSGGRPGPRSLSQTLPRSTHPTPRTPRGASPTRREGPPCLLLRTMAPPGGSRENGQSTHPGHAAFCRGSPLEEPLVCAQHPGVADPGQRRDLLECASRGDTALQHLQWAGAGADVRHLPRPPAPLHPPQLQAGPPPVHPVRAVHSGPVQHLETLARLSP